MGTQGPAGNKGRVDGTQAVRRAAAILRQIGQSVPQGGELTAISTALQLSRSTTHRILQGLVDEELISYDKKSRRYSIGRLTYELGLAATGEALGIGHWRTFVDNVARRTGATTYLMGRSGIEATCLMKAESSAVIRVIPVDLGQRRYLGIGAGATALLAAMDAQDSDRIITTITPHLGQYSSLTGEGVRALVNETRHSGIAVSRGNVTENVIGIGMAITEGPGTARLALSLAALAPREEKTVERWKEIIREEVRAGQRAVKD
ncbi:MAG TPA: helix-turn-helix domain-containing protein [Paracoccus sp.]|nr:helix-turn-helix domain-containing protein [Paracoccus sp. (in: a-proteobacteria)]